MGNIEQALLNAWENDEFQVFLQPQVNVENGKIEGFEALIRWEHPTRGMLLPQDFLPAVRALGMLERLDYFVFEKICIFQKKRMEEDKELFCISCNFVREHFLEYDFVCSLECIREKYEVPAWCVAVEITEGSAFTNEEIVQSNVVLLKELGYPVFLDDYGADQSTFGDLLFHSISHIKLDKKLVDHIQYKNVEVLVHGLCGIAHKLSYQVVCEGVETALQYEAAKKCGVDIIQGFYYYQPMHMRNAEQLYDLKND